MYVIDDFLIQCKKNFYDKITPSNPSGFNSPGYIRLVEIATFYFDKNDYDSVIGFFQEGQYFISLWAAHLLLEYGKPSGAIKSQAIEIIKKYSINPLAPRVAEEEKEWLTKYNEENN